MTSHPDEDSSISNADVVESVNHLSGVVEDYAQQSRDLSEQFKEMIEWKRNATEQEQTRSRRTFILITTFTVFISIFAALLFVIFQVAFHLHSVIVCENAQTVRFEKDIVQRAALNRQAQADQVELYNQISLRISGQQLRNDIKIYISRVDALGHAHLPTSFPACH